MSLNIIPSLKKQQEKRGGYLTRSDMLSVAEQFGVPEHRVEALVTFFPHFTTEPPPQVALHICRDMTCHLKGSVEMASNIKAWVEEKYGDRVDVCGVSCLGRCDRAPAATLRADEVVEGEKLLVARDEQGFKDSIDALMEGRQPTFDTDAAHAEHQIGKWEMDLYGGTGEYTAVKRFIEKGMDADRVLGALEYANLLGMGGAGGRAYRKWGDVLRAESRSGEKYIVCNADESEPGTFKDRDILLAAPYATIEGMILAALVTGAGKGWIYIRHEYPEQIECCRREIERAERLGACGEDIFGSGHSFQLAVYESPGGYICGEQTALIEAMEDKRAEPRIRPPELMTNGLNNEPTLLSNVETFAWAPMILKDGGDCFAKHGKREGRLASGSESKMKGRRLFSLSGDLVNPGVYEVETGITLGEMIDQCCGGMRGGRDIAAVALSGPSGGLLPAKIPVKFLSPRFVEKNLPESIREISVRDLPLDINVSRAVGYMLGAGIVVYGEGCDLLAEAVANSRFYRNESCGKCVPCRIGSQKITEMGERLLAGDVSLEELESFQPTAMQLSEVMVATSICGLGAVASNPISSFLKFFPELARAACGVNPSGAETE